MAKLKSWEKRGSDPNRRSIENRGGKSDSGKATIHRVPRKEKRGGAEKGEEGKNTKIVLKKAYIRKQLSCKETAEKKRAAAKCVSTMVS